MVGLLLKGKNGGSRGLKGFTPLVEFLFHFHAACGNNNRLANRSWGWCPLWKIIERYFPWGCIDMPPEGRLFRFLDRLLKIIIQFHDVKGNLKPEFFARILRFQRMQSAKFHSPVSPSYCSSSSFLLRMRSMFHIRTSGNWA